MDHFILFFYILSFSSGFAAVTVNSIFYIQYKKITSKYTALILFALTLQMLTLTINRYIDMQTGADLSAVKYYSSLIYLSGCLIVIIIYPFLIHKLIGIPLSIMRKRIFLIITFMNFIAGIYYTITYDKRIIFYIIIPFFFISFFYGLILIITNYNSIADKLILKAIKFFCILTVVFLPVTIFEIYREKIAVLKDFYIFEIFSLPLYFFIINIAEIYFSIKRFKQPPFFHNNTLTSYFINRYNITEREVDIISYLIQGFNNTEISKKLFISNKTVENHLTNIYNKVDVKNRIQLVNIILSNN